MKENTASSTLLDDFSRINGLLRKQGLTETLFTSEDPSLKTISTLFKISPVQAALLVLILEQSGSEGTNLVQIGHTAKCGRIQALKFLDDLDDLEARHLILGIGQSDSKMLKRRGGTCDQTYTIPMDVVKAIRAGKEYKYTAYDNLWPASFFETADELLDSYRYKEFDRSWLDRELKTLCLANKNIAFVKALKTHAVSWNMTLLLLVFCCALVQEDKESLPLKYVKMYFGVKEAYQLDTKCKRGEHKLIQEGFLENDFDRGIADTERYRLTDKAREIFLSDLNLKEKTKHSDKNLIRAETITAHELFYSNSLAKRVGELTKLLREENFTDINKRLTEQNMRSGFTCIFSGPPGTGKTETVYQIARETGRNIMLVDISETKGMWFGESEKRIKAVFDRYHGMIKKSGLTPILLFNEADAVLGRRQELGDQRRGPAQTENAIQNIILQEMEDLAGGILIATTNMTCNLDKAFERRFLYKIEFEKPDIQAKNAIWRSILPALGETEAETLARRFDFSGGQIDNIARKFTVSTLLSGRDLSLTEITSLCEEETMEKEAMPIGFCV
jgi:hypothetical protein